MYGLLGNYFLLFLFIKSIIISLKINFNSIIFYQMIYGKPPWQATSEMDLLTKINKYELVFPDTCLVDINVKKLLI